MTKEAILRKMFQPLLERSDRFEVPRDLDRGAVFQVRPQHSGWFALLAADRRRLQSEYARQSHYEGLRQTADPDLGRLLFENRVHRLAVQSQAKEEAVRLSRLLLRAIRTLAHALEPRDAYP